MSSAEQSPNWDQEKWIDAHCRQLTNPEWSVVRIKTERLFTFVQYKKYFIKVAVTPPFCMTICWQAHWTRLSLMQVKFCAEEINNYPQKNGEKSITTLYHIEIQKLTHAQQDCNLERDAVLKIKDRVQGQICFEYQRPGEATWNDMKFPRSTTSTHRVFTSRVFHPQCYTPGFHLSVFSSFFTSPCFSSPFVFTFPLFPSFFLCFFTPFFSLTLVCLPHLHPPPSTPFTLALSAFVLSSFTHRFPARCFSTV